MDIGLLNIDDAERCNAFYNRMHDTKRSLDQWRWEFVPATFRQNTIPYAVVKDKGRIIGTQALIPIRIIDSHGSFWTAKSEETIVDPNYRGQRLFEKMYRLLFDYAEKHSIACIWGFTQAEKPFTRLGFQIPAHTGQLFFPFSAKAAGQLLPVARPDRLSGRAKRSFYGLACAAAVPVSAARLARSRRRLRGRRSLASVIVRTLTEPPPDAGSLCERFIARWGGTTIYRDAEYLGWRIFANPYLKSLFRAAYDGDRLIGWVVVSISDERVGHLVDLIAVADPGDLYTAEEITRLLLCEAAIAARNMGAVAIRGWHVTSHPFDRLLRDAATDVGFYYVRRGHGMVVRDTGASDNRSTNNDYADWYVSRIFTEGLLG